MAPIKGLLAFLNARHEFEKPADLIPMDEYEERLTFASFLRKDRAFEHAVEPERLPLSAVQLFAVMTMPIAILRRHNKKEPGFPKGLENINILVAHFLQKPADDGSVSTPKTDSKKRPRSSKSRDTTPQKKPEQASSSARSPSQLQSPQTISSLPSALTPVATQTVVSRYWRNARQRQKCLDRDHDKCVITNTCDPEVCHIIPCAWNTNLENMAATAKALKNIRCLVEVEDFSSDLVHSIYTERGSSDKVWNMIALNHQLHQWWSKAYFGLKYEGISYPDPQQATIHLQFQWMPQYGQKTDRLRPVFAERQTIDGILAKAPDYPSTNISFQPSSRPLRSGHNFAITMEKTQAPNFTAMIKLQWAVIKVAALSGAGEQSEFSRDPDDEGGVRQWLESLEMDPLPVPEDALSEEGPSIPRPQDENKPLPRAPGLKLESLSPSKLQSQKPEAETSATIQQQPNPLSERRPRQNTA
ncbi:hypothetical protein BKA56DRAFT_616878 [Ilyonectria sp. MPI-CAGE-AT-0026]|nr:hypothetical protein BKA56DRAFT_616878 [Ilyonectria sp. MPI-CAGE-AT-0026]